MWFLGNLNKFLIELITMIKACRWLHEHCQRSTDGWLATGAAFIPMRTMQTHTHLFRANQACHSRAGSKTKLFQIFIFTLINYTCFQKHSIKGGWWFKSMKKLWPCCLYNICQPPSAWLQECLENGWVLGISTRFPSGALGLDFQNVTRYIDPVFSFVSISCHLKAGCD